MMGMQMESTVYVKGKRKRTEAAAIMGMGPTVMIEQCDLKRYVKLNDKKRVYLIEPFADDEVTDENGKTLTPVVTKTNTTKKGGIIYMYYNITDTGERKKMYDFTARHVWTNQKIKASPEACSMQDSLMIKTDGWYIDLPEFNCPVHYKPGAQATQQSGVPECRDRYVTKMSGKGKLGFPLKETMTITMGGGGAKTSEISSTLETLEFSAATLDAALFEIPPGYTQVKTEAELMDEMNMKDIINQYKKNIPTQDKTVSEVKPIEKIRIAVFVPKGEGGFTAAELQQYLVSSLSNPKIEAIAVNSDEEAKKFNCNYSLSTEFIKIKSGSKVGGLMKAIKTADPNAASSFTIENSVTLKSLADGSVRLQKKIDGKYDGKIDDAAKKSLDEESQLVLDTINQ